MVSTKQLSNKHKLSKSKKLQIKKELIQESEVRELSTLESIFLKLGRPLRFTSPKALKDKVEEYFKKPKYYVNQVPSGDGGVVEIKSQKPFSIIELQIHLECSPDTFSQFLSGKYDHHVSSEDRLNYGTFSEILTRAKQICKQSLYDFGMNPANRNTQIVSLNLQANYGEHTTVKVEKDEEALDAKKLREKTEADLVDDILGLMNTKEDQ